MISLPFVFLLSVCYYEGSCLIIIIVAISFFKIQVRLADESKLRVIFIQRGAHRFEENSPNTSATSEAVNVEYPYWTVHPMVLSAVKYFLRRVKVPLKTLPLHCTPWKKRIDHLGWIDWRIMLTILGLKWNETVYWNSLTGYRSNELKGKGRGRNQKGWRDSR